MRLHSSRAQGRGCVNTARPIVFANRDDAIRSWGKVYATDRRKSNAIRKVWFPLKPLPCLGVGARDLPIPECGYPKSPRENPTDHAMPPAQDGHGEGRRRDSGADDEIGHMVQSASRGPVNLPR